MKNTLLIFILLYCQAVHSQTLVVHYPFSIDGSDVSGNDNDGILVGNSYTAGPGDNVLLTGQDTSSYMIIPANVFNGLQDFRIYFKGHIKKESIDANYYFSASNPGCIRCCALSKEGADNSFRLELNGSVYHFADGGSFDRHLKLIRQSGILYFFKGCNLLGVVEDNTPLYITSIIVGQAENCVGGCFGVDQLLRGGIDNFKVWDYAFFKQCEEYVPKSGESLVPAYADKILSVNPNPFSSSATISFSLEENSQTIIELYDVAGRKIKTLVDENVSSGNHEVQLKRDHLSAGIYFLQVKTNDIILTRKLVIQ